MRCRPFGLTGVHVSVIGQGTWQLERADLRDAQAAIMAGVEAGMTHIDTGEMYGDGAVENLLGGTLHQRRDEVFLASKVLPANATFTGTLLACERSLRRLRTDRLDLYLLHWPGPYALNATLDAFRRLREDGKILHYGVSNFDERWLRRLADVTESGEIACNQVLYHLGERAIEHRVRPASADLGLATVGYSPFGCGAFPPSNSAEQVLSAIAERHRATAHRIALAFLARQPDTFLIPKAARPEHVTDNAQATDLILSEEDIAAIDAACPIGPDDGRLPTI